MSEELKENKEARKKRKEERRRKRESFQNRLAAVNNGITDERNPIIIEIVRDHLKKDIDVFQARWQSGAPLSNQVFLNTPLFWYKKHKWSHKDVKEFFKITNTYKENLDSELAIIWGIDESAKKKKKEKRKRLKEKHLRKESFASLLTLRHSSLRLMQERSMQFVQKNDPKADRASVKIWNLLTRQRAEQEREYLSHNQFNISLVDNNISVDPDLSVDLFYELTRTWEIIEKHREDKKNNPQKYAVSKKEQYKKARGGVMSIKAIGGSSAYKQFGQTPPTHGAVWSSNSSEKEKKEEEKDADPPQSEKIKYIKKRKIDRQYIKRMLRHINKNIKREHQIANPKKLKKSKLLLVVFGKIFDAIQNRQAFDVQNDYISQALTNQQLNNPTELLEILETRDAEWKQRLQCLQYIESNISINENLSPLFDEEAFLLLILGWTTQLYDERSRITQTAAELFPSLLTQLLSAMDTPAIVFDQENGCLSCILDGLFTLLKNKRARTLADIAHDVLIETINILSTVAGDLDETAYMKIIKFLEKHSRYDQEKHEKVRGGCILYALFVVYGTETGGKIDNFLQVEAQQLSKSVSFDSASDNEADVDDGKAPDSERNVKKKEKEKKKDARNVKMAKFAQRAFLFKDDAFMQIFASMIGNGIEDRSKETRDKTMKVLKKIESRHSDILERYIDEYQMKKYQKWLRFNQPKKKGKKGKKGGKKRERIQIRRVKTQGHKRMHMLNKQGVGAKSAQNSNSNHNININNNDENVDTNINVPNGTSTQ